MDPGTAQERLDEGLDVILQAWREGRVTFSGRHYQFHDVIVRPSPVQHPHPPVWLAAVSEESFERAGRLGCNLLSGTVLGLNREVASLRRADYLRGLEDGGHSPKGHQSGCLVIVYVGETVERARSDFDASAGWYMERIGRFMGLDPERNDAIVCGSPELVTERLHELQQIYGFTELLCWTRVGGLEPEKALRSMELMQQKVIPHLRDSQPPPLGH